MRLRFGWDRKLPGNDNPLGDGALDLNTIIMALYDK